MNGVTPMRISHAERRALLLVPTVIRLMLLGALTLILAALVFVVRAS
jgi:hypothetical protein